MDKLIIEKLSDIQTKVYESSCSLSEFTSIKESIEDLLKLLKNLNEATVSEQNLKLCPNCKQPYITYTCDEYYQCNSCDHSWA